MPPPLRSGATQVTMLAIELLVHIANHLSPTRRTKLPFCVAPHNIPRLSSQMERIGEGVDEASSNISRRIPRREMRSRPPPSVPAQILPSRSSHRQEILGCDVSIFWNRRPSYRKRP